MTPYRIPILTKRYLLALLLILHGLLIFFYGRSISEFYGLLANNEINIDLYESNIHKLMVLNQKEYLYSCLNELTSKGKMDLMTTSEPKEVDRKNLSICNEAASKRGPHQQVVSFSFYGKIIQDRNYFQGIEENAKLMGKIYPKWIMRLYHDIPPLTQHISISKNILNEFREATNSTAATLKDHFFEVIKGLISSPQVHLCLLQHIYPNLDLCYVENISGYGKLLEHHPMTWRFLPVTDPLVDVFLSRDLDSRIGEREVAAVNEWLASNLTFHIMRDHPHHRDHILGGMWGAFVDKERNLLIDIVRRIIKGAENHYHYGKDQHLLRDILWPVLKGKVMQHDSYQCKHFSSHGNMRPWPSKRRRTPYNFVGAQYGVHKKPLLAICPRDCRPKDKQNWLYC